MKKTTFFLFFALLAGWCNAIYAQVGVNNGVKFDEESFDFGTFDEGKLAEHLFTFTNKTGKTVTINNVQASCGCTTPSWTKEPIVNNGKGSVTAAYNSEGRPGMFSKTVTVTLTEDGGTPQTVVLSIKGNVTGKPRPKAEEINAWAAFDKDQHNFGKIQVGQKVAKTFTFKNTGTTDLVISSMYAQCNCVSMQTSFGAAIKPNETGTIELVYAPTKPTTQDEMVILFTNSTTQPQVVLTLKGEVVEALNSKSILKESDGF